MDDADALADVDLGDGIVDTAMNDTMEDLFGEAAEGLDLGDVSAAIPAASLPPPPALLARLEEMHSTGCCAKIAWSNTGSIAHITPDGTKVNFMTYARDLSKGQWTLSKPTKRALLAPAGRRFVHISFNTVGQDLLTFDDLGQAHMYSVVGGNGKMNPVTIETSEGDNAASADAIIGLHWLPIYPLECRAMYIGPVSRSISGWTSVQRSRDQHAVKVHHPHDNSRAVFSVSKTGKISMCFQNGGWRSVTSSLNLQSSASSLLSHAHMCEHQGELLLAAADESQRLQVFSIRIEWNATYGPGQSGAQQVMSVAPTLHVKNLLTISDARPRHHNDARLTQLLLIPATAEVADQSMSTSTTVLAVYVRANSAGYAAGFVETSTILVRWQVASESPSLHDGFKSLKPNASITNSLPARAILRRQPDLTTSKILLNINSICFDTILLCTTSESSVEFRDRATFDSLEAYMDTDHVNSLPQSGFNYVSGAHNINAATSYDGSAMVYERPDNKIEVATMVLQYGWQRMDGSSEVSSLAEAAVVAVARQFMSMTCGNIMPDEVLSLLPRSLPNDLQQLLTREAFRLTRHNPDIAVADEKMRAHIVLREPLLPRAYSLQLFTGTTISNRTTTGQFAWTILNLRHICNSVSQSIMRVDPTQSFSVDLIHSLRGLAKWGVDLIVYILRSIMQVKEIATKDLSQQATKVFEKHMQDSNDPTIMLLLCSYPRTLLGILTQFLPRLIKLSQVATQRATSVLQRQQLTEVGRLEKGVPFAFEAFKTFLDQIGATMQAKLPPSQAKPGDTATSSDTIIAMTGTIPDDLEQPLRALLISAIPTVLQDANLAAIYFSDTLWLGLGGEKSMAVARTFDALKKTPLQSGASIRSCRRCGSVMEDFTFSADKPREHPAWLLSAQRACLCTCSWFIP